MSLPDRLRAALPDPSDFPSPLHSPRVAARIGVWLAAAFTVCFLTGLVSHFFQHPTPWVPLPLRPVWLYQVTQGLHVGTGIATIPLLGVKLWVVTPRLWHRPLVTGAANVLERVSILVLVGAAAFELIGGLLNVAEYYPWAFFFPSVHYAVAWIAVGALALHVAVKLPVIRTALTRRADEAAATDIGPVLQSAKADVAGDGALSRRGLLAVTAGGAAVVALAGIGDRIPFLSSISVLAQRRGSGPHGLPVNRSAAAAGVRAAAQDPAWRLTVSGPNGTRAFALADLEAMPQHTVDLPIACVEGWSRQATWTGVRLRDLLATVGAGQASSARAVSLDPGIYGRADIPADVAQDRLSLVALGLSGATLDLDHGYPARLITPARPGVLQTKWLSRIEVG